MKKRTKIILIVLILILSLIISGAVYIYCANDHKIAVLAYHGVLPKEKNTSGDNLIVDFK